MMQQQQASRELCCSETAGRGNGIALASAAAYQSPPCFLFLTWRVQVINCVNLQFSITAVSANDATRHH
jgi:hypothetical protein